MPERPCRGRNHSAGYSHGRAYGEGPSVANDTPAKFRAEFVDWIIELMVESGMIGAQLGAAVRCRSHLDETRVRRSLRLLADAQPVLGCRFVVAAGVPRWERLDDLDERMRVDVAPSSDPEADATAFVASGLDPREGPQVQAVVLRGPDGDTLAIKATHVALDGGALKQMLYILGGYYRALGADPSFVPEPETRPRSLETIARTASLVERLRAVRIRKNWPRTDWGIPGLGGKGEPTYISDSIGADDFGPLIQYGKARGATVHDLLLAAYYRALFAELGPPPGARTPVNMSADLRAWLPEDAVMPLANLPITWTIAVTPVVDETFEGTLARVVERTRAWKDADVGRTRAVETVLGDRVIRLLGMPTLRRVWARIDRSMEGTGFPSLTNIGEIDDPALDFGPDAPVADAYLFGSIGYPGGLMVAVTTFRRVLRISAGIDLLSVDVAMVRRILHGTVAELLTVARAPVSARGAPAPLR
jgi:NRPS condensation-like uncharacterized protein